MHEVLLLLFGKGLAARRLTEFIDADEKEDAFQVGDFSESLEEQGFNALPAFMVLRSQWCLKK